MNQIRNKSNYIRIIYVLYLNYIRIKLNFGKTLVRQIYEWNN
jgi:hypothetical protein